MKVELYLENINMEFANVEKDAGKYWNKWKQSYGPYVSCDRSLKPEELLYRTEEFGGLVFNPRSNKVFKVDSDVIDVLVSLQGKTLDEVSKDKDVEEATINAALSRLLDN